VAKLTITGVYGADGEYEFDFDQRPFTNGELHTIKQVAGVRAGEMQEAIEKDDNDVLVALALVVLGRHGKRVPVQAMWLADVGSLVFDFTEVAEEEQDPTVPPPSGLASQEIAPETSEPSGLSSNGTQDDPQASIHPSTGTPH
jgi:hypothetical protein